MSLSPPVSEPMGSPTFESGPPLSLRSGPRDEVRRNFGLFDEVSDHEIELDTNTHKPIGSTPKNVDNTPLSRFSTKSKDSPGNYDNIINLVKETSISYEQNKKLKDLTDLEDLKRGIYNQPKLDRPPESRVRWDPSIKKARVQIHIVKNP